MAVSMTKGRRCRRNDDNQQPELLRAINENQQEFLQMMNEPVDDAPAAASSSLPTAALVGDGTAAEMALMLVLAQNRW